MKIYLSPSNQNNNPYAYGNTNEMEQCNRIAQSAEKHLKRNGYEVKLADKGQNMYTSIRESNDWGADLHIPIHTNAGGGGGTVVFAYSNGANNMKFANPIYKEVQAVSPGTTDYGVRVRQDLAELNGTNAICVYIECEFHDSAEYAKWIINNVDKFGEAIAKGVCKADGKTYKAETVTPVASVCTVTLPILKKGAKGSYVSALQALLNLNGAKLNIKGQLIPNIGNNTDKAIRDYQKKKGLTVDGVVGKKTWEKLFK